MNIPLEVQRALIALGYDLGPAGADGIMGRRSIAAVAEFQKNKGLDIQYPGTIGPKTLKALGIGGETAAASMDPIWITEARRLLGLHEKHDAKRLDAALGLDTSEIPWCGAFVGMVIAAVLPKEPLPANPLGARNWLKAGTSLPGPQVGAIAVFWRGSRSGWSGHVGFVVGHDKTHLHILGGNQSDSVSISRISKDRLLGYRWPLTAPAAPTAALPMSLISATITNNEA